MDDKIAKIRSAANKYIRAGRWIASYNIHLLFHNENGIPVPETFPSKETAVRWMEKELEEKMGIFKDHGIDRYRIIEKNFFDGQPTFLLFEASVRGIRVCWTLERVTAQNVHDIRKTYFREARKSLTRYSYN